MCVCVWGGLWVYCVQRSTLQVRNTVRGIVSVPWRPSPDTDVFSLSVIHSFSLIPSSAGNDNSDSKPLLLLVLWLLVGSGVCIHFFLFSSIGCWSAGAKFFWAKGQTPKFLRLCLSLSVPISPPTDRTNQQSWCCPADCQSSLVVASCPNQLDFVSCHCYSLRLHTYHTHLLLVFWGYAGVGDYINVGRVFCGRHSWPALCLSKTLSACRAENFVLLVCVCGV